MIKNVTPYGGRMSPQQFLYGKVSFCFLVSSVMAGVMVDKTTDMEYDLIWLYNVVYMGDDDDFRDLITINRQQE